MCLGLFETLVDVQLCRVLTDLIFPALMSALAMKVYGTQPLKR